MLIDFLHLKGITGVLHCGAHTGEEAPQYAAAGHKHVLWIEGNKDVIEELRENVVLYPHNAVRQAMLWSRPGPKTFFVTNNVVSSSLLPLKEHSEFYPDVTLEEVNLYDCTTLKHLLGDVGGVKHWMHLNFWNLDLQGAELEVLRGAGDTLDRCDYLLTELSFVETYEGCALEPEVTSYLNDMGFMRFVVAKSKNGMGAGLYVRRNKCQ